MRIHLKRRIAAVLVLLLLLVAGLAACSAETPAESSYPEQTSPEESLPEQSNVPQDPYKDADGRYAATLSGKTYGGRKVTFLSANVFPTYNSEILYNDYEKRPVDDTDHLPEVVNKAQGDRTQYVESQLEIEIDEIFLFDLGRKGALMASRVRTDNLSQTAEYQIIIPGIYDGASLAADGQLIDLNGIEGLDMAAPWWDRTFNEENAIAGQLYYTIGEIGTENKARTSCLFFNKSMYDRYNLAEKYGGTPYELVRSGDWTLDLVVAMSKEISEDLDSDGVITYKDRYGWGGQLDDMWSLFYGSGSRIASAKSADGYPELTMYSERSAAVMESMQDLVQDKQHYVTANDYFHILQWPGELLEKNFAAGNNLFYNGTMSTAIVLGEMDDLFGMLPVPKGDKTQDRYYSLVNQWQSSCFAVPISLADEDRVLISDVLNAMGAASANFITPAYIRQCIEYMKVRDDDSVDMIENYILPGRGCDVGMVYAWGGLDELLHEMARQPIGSFASNYESRKNTAETAMEKTIAYFRSIQ